MKRAVLVLVFALLFVACAFAGTYVEVEQIVAPQEGPAAAPQKMLVKAYIQKGKMRAEISGGGPIGGVFLVLLEENKTYAIIDQMKMYMEMPMTGTVPSVGDMGVAKVEELGKTSTIAGYECAGYKLKSEGEEATVWLAKDLSLAEDWAGFYSSLTKDVPEESKAELAKLKGFPMMVETAEGKLAVTKIEKKDLEESLFAIPAGYQKMEMPAMPASPGAAPR